MRGPSRTGLAPGPSPGSFSDESCKDGADAVLGHAASPLYRFARPQKWVRQRFIELHRSVYSLFCKPQEYADAETSLVFEPADLGTHARGAASQNHAETGTHRLSRNGCSRPDGRFPRRNGYAGKERRSRTAREGRFLWITLWTTQCCPRRFRYGRCAEAGPVSRRSGYAVSQNRVRTSAESSTVLPPKPRPAKALRVAYTVYL